MTETDTCRKFVVPLHQAAGWDNDPHSIAEKVAPIWRHGNVAEICRKFGGPDQLRSGVNQLQALLYS